MPDVFQQTALTPTPFPMPSPSPQTTVPGLTLLPGTIYPTFQSTFPAPRWGTPSPLMTPWPAWKQSLDWGKWLVAILILFLSVQVVESKDKEIAWLLTFTIILSALVYRGI
jgi:hypothetical protein